MKVGAGINFEGYTFFGRTRSEGNGGGVGILVKNELKTQVAPHSSSKDIEILWLSLRRSGLLLFIGVYYGKQESRVPKAEIENEMDLLTEDILEKQSEGEVLLIMDGNGRIGLLGEKVSRNGALLQDVFEKINLTLMNESEKCHGKITRQNTKRSEEKSAIDFVVCTEEVQRMIQEVVIDEEGLHKLKGTNETDHNSIIVHLNINSMDGINGRKKVDWRLRAPEEKWQQYRDNLGKLRDNLKDHISEPVQQDFSLLYHEWLKEVEHAARNSIGKTTFKNNGKEKFSEQVKQKRIERRVIKKEFMEEKDIEEKEKKKVEYIEKQKEVRQQIEVERKERLLEKIEKMSQQGDVGFWKERRNIKRDRTEEWAITKDPTGKRLFGPAEIKRNVAEYYEGLYKKNEVDFHSHHDIVKERIKQNMENRDFEMEEYNALPSREEIMQVIQKKKNGKSSTDLKNEMLKNGGEEMVDLVEHLVKIMWKREKVPHQWNQGHITSIWKGKGDREILSNHRGITVSSAVGTIPEEIINNRILEILPFTQAQAGGRKGCGTFDHLFIIRGIVSYAMKTRKRIIVTFYDVKKAYDHADVDDMLDIIWERGVRGKIWRLTKRMNQPLTAKIKTKFGMTHEIERETGSKQGGKTIVSLFSKMTDVLSEDISEDESLGVDVGGVTIGATLFEDDVATLAEGYKQQEATLMMVNEFAKKHKLQWGMDKCKVLEIGSHKDPRSNWKLGSQTIEGANSYKYLGDVVMRNGSNKENIEERKKKVKNSTWGILTCGAAETINKIELKASMKLHETVTVPGLLINSETWILTKSDIGELEKTELWALKRLIGLPRTTPSVAVRFVTGTLYMKVQIDIRQLLYLHKVLQRETSHWTHHVLLLLDGLSIGWASQIRERLVEYDLERDWQKVKEQTKAQWKTNVMTAAEQRNKDLMIEECHSVRDGSYKEKTKTKNLTALLESETYKRGQCVELMSLDKMRAKTIIMARYGMLNCANNFENMFGNKTCGTCKVIDDEMHRINSCKLWQDINKFNSTEKFVFGDVFTGDRNVLKEAADVILSIWNIEKGQNCMKALS